MTHPLRDKSQRDAVRKANWIGGSTLIDQFCDALDESERELAKAYENWRKEVKAHHATCDERDEAVAREAALFDMAKELAHFAAIPHRGPEESLNCVCQDSERVTKAFQEFILSDAARDLMEKARKWDEHEKAGAWHTRSHCDAERDALHAEVERLKEALEDIVDGGVGSQPEDIAEFAHTALSPPEAYDDA